MQGVDRGKTTMTAAIVIIAFVAYVVSVVRSAMSFRNWPIAAAIIAGAAALYVALLISGLQLDVVVRSLYSAIGFGASIVICAAMFGLGFIVPAVLSRTQQMRTARRAAALFLSVFATCAGIDLWRTARLPAQWFASPGLWFAIGVATFLVFKARVFEDGPDVSSRRAA